MNSNDPAGKMSFERVGDSWQIAVRTADDLFYVRELDGALWAMTSLPVESVSCDMEFLTFMDDDENGRIPADPELTALAYDSAVKVVGEDSAFKGTIATGDQFVASESYVKVLQDRFNALACEMEGAAVALVAYSYDVPFVVIRCMSDKADGLAHDTYANFGDTAADNSATIVMTMLESM